MDSNLLVDLYKVSDPYCGLGQFSLNFREELSSRANLRFNLHLLHPAPLPSPTGSITYHRITPLNRYLPRLGPAPDIWHSLYQNPSHPPHPRSRQIMTVHDLNFLTQRKESQRARRLARLQRSVDRAEQVVAISGYTKRVMEENLELRGKEVRVIYNGVRLDRFEDVERPEFLPEGPYFFSIGVFSAKKNFHTLLPLLQHFPEHHLVIAGRNQTAYGERVVAEAKGLGIADRLILPGTITDQQKYALLTNTEALLFPSLAEGFGLPIIEALLAGRPVFTSNSTSLPEIGGGQTFIWEDFDPGSMAGLLKEGLATYHADRKGYADTYRAYGETFSWQRCIDNYLDLYGEL